MLLSLPSSSRLDRRSLDVRPHVDLRAEAEAGSSVLPVEVENHPLTLSDHAEDRACQGVGRQVVLAAVGVANQHAFPRPRVVRLDYSLHKRGPPPAYARWVHATGAEN